MRSSEQRALEPAVVGFADNSAHLRAEFWWLRQLIRAEIRVSDRRSAQRSADEFAGLYISREEVDRYVEWPAAPVEPRSDEWLHERRDIADQRRSLDRQAAVAAAEGVDLRLERLTRIFALDEVARGAILCCVAAELDGQISRLFAYLQDDATKRRPTFAVLARLLAPGSADPVSVRSLFGPACPLHIHGLLEWTAGTADGPFSAVEARLAPGVVDFLIGSDRLPPLLADAVRSIVPGKAMDDLSYYAQHARCLEQLLRMRRAEGRLPLCYIGGPRGAGEQLIAEGLARALSKGLLLVDAAKLPLVGGRLEEFGLMLGREARLRDCVVLLQDVDDILRDVDRDAIRALPIEGLLRGLTGCDVIVSGVMPTIEFRQKVRTRPLGFDLTFPTLTERVEIWERCLKPRAVARLGSEIRLLASKFHFTPGQIARAVALAEMTAGRDVEGEPSIEGSELHARCRDEAESGLHQFCQKITARYGWDDIVLPADAQAQLKEICRWVKHRGQVYDGWGFGAKFSYGKGLAILLSGASGTGKTMSVEIIARDLQLDLFRVDLSRIVSKYIGETERNLSRIFSQSASGNCVLFFDEADALFGKRTEVKDAHDRYANIEVNYLLAEMDRYEGIIIIATNMKGNLDQAFLRRFSHVIEYPLPDERLREMIWRKSFPSEAPIRSDVDFDFLAQKIGVPGGSIRNIALSSAFLALADGTEIAMEHVIRATKREYQKIGRICSKSDFGQYYAMIREGERV
ncbi:AAA family ATPase [Bradyrhizobium sp. HKCCYLS20291]|uniref:AAA family ATPase n=1 Tax=Bradyrhizobium sp. HKCCYLS20291 TaxID=3420766 RepID=UPI003EBD7CB8